MHALPVVSITNDFIANGTFDPFKSGSVLVPLVHPVSKWEMQATGLNAAGTAIVAPTAWDVLLLASLDGIAFPDTSLILEHKNGTNANGDVVWPTVSTVSPFRDAKFIRLKMTAINLNTAAMIRVTVRGF